MWKHRVTSQSTHLALLPLKVVLPDMVVVKLLDEDKKRAPPLPHDQFRRGLVQSDRRHVHASTAVLHHVEDSFQTALQAAVKTGAVFSETAGNKHDAVGNSVKCSRSAFMSVVASHCARWIPQRAQ